MKAVLWTDVFQMALILTSLLAALLEGVRRMGFEHVWNTAADNGRINVEYVMCCTLWVKVYEVYYYWLLRLYRGSASDY